MRHPEQKQWQYLSTIMAGKWNAQRHEDKYSAGVPDVSYSMNGVDGWIELKTIESWPKNIKTTINIPHLKAGQVNWLEEFGKAGSGRMFLLLSVGEVQCSSDWVLIPWNRVRGVYDKQLSHMDLWDNILKNGTLTTELCSRLTMSYK